MVTGERQAARIRGLYLKTILRQDVAFFDKETKTGEVIGRMSGDTVLIQDAMGEKVLLLLSINYSIINNYYKKLDSKLSSCHMCHLSGCDMCYLHNSLFSIKIVLFVRFFYYFY